MAEIEEYAEGTISPIYYLIIESAVSKDSDLGLQLRLDHVGSHLGKAEGIGNLLRGLRHNSKYGTCYIPSQLLIKHKASHEDFLRGKTNQGIQDAVFELATTANHHLNHTKKLINESGAVKKFRDIFLPSYTIGEYLKKLEKLDFDPFHPALSRRNGMLPLKLWCHLKLIQFNIS